MKKFKLTNKLSFIVGGAGLVGKEITKLAAQAGSKIIILDVNKFESNKLVNKISNNKLKFHYFDCSDNSNIENNFRKIIEKYGCPHVLINCSYPITKDWKNSSFEKISKKTSIYHMPFERSVDIDSLADFNLVKYFINNKKS